MGSGTNYQPTHIIRFFLKSRFILRLLIPNRDTQKISEIAPKIRIMNGSTLIVPWDFSELISFFLSNFPIFFSSSLMNFPHGNETVDNSTLISVFLSKRANFPTIFCNGIFFIEIVQILCLFFTLMNS